MRRFGRTDPTDTNIYVLQMDAAQKRRSAHGNLIYTAGIAAVHLAMGLLNQPSSRTFYVVYPYLFVFLPLIYAFLGVATDLGATARMTSRQYHEGIQRIRRSLLAVLALEGVGVVLDLVYLWRHFGSAPMGWEILYLLLHLPVMALVVLYGRYYDRTFANIQIGA